VKSTLGLKYWETELEIQENKDPEEA